MFKVGIVTAGLVLLMAASACGQPTHIDGVSCVLIKTPTGVKVYVPGQDPTQDQAASDPNQESASGSWQNDVCVQNGPWESSKSLNPNGPQPPDCTIIDNRSGDATPGWYNSAGVCTPNGQ